MEIHVFVANYGSESQVDELLGALEEVGHPFERTTHDPSVIVRILDTSAEIPPLLDALAADPRTQWVQYGLQFG